MGINIGCSRESAARIVDLLYRESDGGALLLLNKSLAHVETKAVKPPPPKPPSPERSSSARGGNSKITPQILLFAHDPDRRLLDVAEIRRQIKDTFGISMSSCTIYKIWKMPPTSAKGKGILAAAK